MLAYVFPGQGAQKKGMGGTLFDEFPQIVTEADDVLGYSIKELCLDDHGSKLNQTEYTQPALYTVNALHYYKKIKDTGVKPDYVAGHSLGEYNALLAAGAFDFATGLRLVQKRGELMSRAAGGGMAAVLGLSEDEIREALRTHRLESIDVANLNSPKQIVISGSRTDMDQAKPVFEGMEGVMMFIPLRTSGAFHSRYMEEAAREFESFLQQYSFHPLVLPVISNVYARPYRQREISSHLVKQITHSVKWTETVRYLCGRGVDVYEEMGPGRVLTDLISRVRTEAPPLIVEEAEAEEDVNLMDGRRGSHEQLPTGCGDTPEIRTFTGITAASLGSEQFRKDYNLKYAYMTGAMYRGIASKEMVVRMGRAGMMGFFGAGGLKMPQIEEAIVFIKGQLGPGQAYGLNLVHNPSDPAIEEQTVDLFLKHGITVVEAAAFMSITPALVKYRANGLVRGADGQVLAVHKMIAKVSRPEVAELFLSPAPERILRKLIEERKITPQQAEMLREIPVADDICAEADSGGHTDGAVAYALMPTMIRLRDEMMAKYGYSKQVRIGAAGGIGTPEAAAAAFMLGADFVVTGSINQCTVEAGTSDEVKDLLQQANVQDTEYAPAGDMFEMGARVQVLKKGLFFPARANKLYDLYRQYNSIDEIDDKTKAQIQEKYFKRSFESIYDTLCASYPHVVDKAERNPKFRMALIFRWYFTYTTRLAIQGDAENKVDYQIHCGPALGAFNQWVRGTELEHWRNRHVDQIGEKLMLETAELLNRRFSLFAGAVVSDNSHQPGTFNTMSMAARS